MAVAEKTMVERTPRSPERELAFRSLLGAVFVLGCLGLIFSALPWSWGEIFGTGGLNLNPFLSEALLLIVVLGVAVGVIFLGRYLEKSAAPPHGFRAGVFATIVAVLIVVWITSWLGGVLSEAELGPFGAVLTLGVAAGLIFAAWRLFLKPGFAAWLASVEDLGWFHALSYKGNQGVRVRRGTMLAFIILGACGIYTMVAHKTLGSDVLGTGNNWELAIPFTYDEVTNNYLYVPLMFQVHYTLPLVLALLLIWVSWRAVNWPAFADFLIATEAELNKVSWTSRKNLVKDTIVVLVTVTLMTFFLFFVDILWIKMLTFVQVLKVDIRAEQLKQQEKTQW